MMNNRIRQLAEQANVTEIIDDTYLERNDWLPHLERFAKLIVRECYAWAQLNGGLGEECDYTELKRHLGIKE